MHVFMVDRVSIRTNRVEPAATPHIRASSKRVGGWMISISHRHPHPSGRTCTSFTFTSPRHLLLPVVAPLLGADPRLLVFGRRPNAIMGRKPNLLIQEFFQRGAKLDDQSNRYEHTCKKCGMFVSNPIAYRSEPADGSSSQKDVPIA